MAYVGGFGSPLGCGVDASLEVRAGLDMCSSQGMSFAISAWCVGGVV